MFVLEVILLLFSRTSLPYFLLIEAIIIVTWTFCLNCKKGGARRIVYSLCQHKNRVHLCYIIIHVLRLSYVNRIKKRNFFKITNYNRLINHQQSDNITVYSLQSGLFLWIYLGQQYLYLVSKTSVYPLGNIAVIFNDAKYGSLNYGVFQMLT